MLLTHGASVCMRRNYFNHLYGDVRQVHSVLAITLKVDAQVPLKAAKAADGQDTLIRRRHEHNIRKGEAESR